MKNSVIRRNLNKSIACILMGITLFTAVYSPFRTASDVKAMGTTVVFGLTLEECLMYLAGICGVGLAGSYIAGNPLSESDKAIFKENFEESCKQKSISQAKMIEWETQLISGQLDKASECWKAFLDAISQDVSKPVGSFIMPDGTIALDNLISEQEFNVNHYYYGDCTVSLTYSDFLKVYKDLPMYADIVSVRHWLDSDNYLNVDIQYANLRSDYPQKLILKKGDVYQGTVDDCVPISSNTVRLNCSFSDKNYSISGRSNFYTNSYFKTYKDFDAFVYTYPMLSGGDAISSEWGTKTVSATAHYPGWNNVFDNGNSLSDYVDVIGAGATADSDVISIPWDNVSDGTGHLADKWEKLWEKLASGEITWEQFIEAVQEGVGTIALEKEATGEIEGEGDDAHPVVIEKEVVPQNPDKPRTKDEIYEDNTLNASMTFDLKEIFPFCIPWDIYNIFSYLNQEPVAPKFEIPIPSYDKSGKLTFSNTITVDLSMFDSVALVFRVCMFLLFCLGLAIVTRTLIRG